MIIDIIHDGSVARHIDNHSFHIWVHICDAVIGINVIIKACLFRKSFIALRGQACDFNVAALFKAKRCAHRRFR